MATLSLALGLILHFGGVSGRPAVRPGNTVIAGNVVCETGTPTFAAWVNASRWITVAGKPRFVASQGVQAQPDRSFRIEGLPPGTYMLSATRADDPAATSGVEAYRPTDLLEPLQLSPGSELRGVRIVLRKARVFGISGTIVAATTGDSVPNARLVLTPVEPKDVGSHSTRIEHGTFRFTNVLPGSYLLQTNPNELVLDKDGVYRKIRVHCRQRITIGGADLQGIRLQLGPGGELTGSFKNVDASAAVNGALLALEPLEGIGPVLCVRGEANGAFHVSNLPPDRYRVYAAAPQGTYVKSIRVDGHEIKGAIDLTAGHVNVEILLSPNAAQVSGRVRNGGRRIAVVLCTADGSNPRLTTTSARGNFTFQNLGPGNYWVVALANADLIPPDDLDTWRTLRRQATPVQLREGARVRVEVTVAPKRVSSRPGAAARRTL